MLKIILLVVALNISGCGIIMAPMFFDYDPFSGKVQRYCPVEKKKVWIDSQSVSTTCDGNWSCPELFTPRRCTKCTTSYKDDQGHVWSDKPETEILI